MKLTVLGVVFSLFSTVLLAQSKKEFKVNQISNNESIIESESSLMMMAGGACSSTVDAAIDLIECVDVGKKGFDKLTTTLGFTSSTTVSSPSSYGSNSDPSCTSNNYDDNGQWQHYSLEAGIESIYLELTGAVGGIGGSLTNVYAALYQGTDCNNLTEVGCDNLLYEDGGTLYINPITFSGLDSSQDLWVYTYGDDSYTTLVTDIFGMASAANTDCASAGTNMTTGCNVGAGPTTWGSTDAIVGPESDYGGNFDCVGTASWSSNENTVYYEVTATSSTGSVQIDNVKCNNGKTGDAQFGIFDDCSCFMSSGYTSDACFLGCSGGTGTITLSMTAGESYIIAVDGFAGDFCKWDFTFIGVTPLANDNLIFNVFEAKNNATLNWTAIENVSTSHFLIERIGVDGENITRVNYNGASQYTFVDEAMNPGSYLYKIIQVTHSGEEMVSEIRSINIKQESPFVKMNTTTSEIEVILPSIHNLNYNASVYNNLGQLISSSLISEKESNIQINSNDRGTYYVVLKDLKTTEVFSYKLLK